MHGIVDSRSAVLDRKVRESFSGEMAFQQAREGVCTVAMQTIRN